jgi:two-component system NtrC family response regulator
VSATNRPVAELTTADGGLREDLFYRVSELLIELPPLRERPLQGLASDAVAAVAGHAWPGNVRELENRMKRAVVMAEGPRIRATDLGLVSAEAPLGGETSLRSAVGAAERESVVRAWAESGHNVSRASRLLGVSRPTLYKLLREHGLRD